MLALPLIATKPVILLTLRSARRAAAGVGRWYCNLLADAALERGRAVASVYLMAMGMDERPAKTRERDY